MRGFDVLDPDLPLFQNHFLEASAGTGKTFAIENLVIRMLEEGLTLDQILVVTFTRAATVELKERIRAHLSAEQLGQFDEARIWTIHSFCFHMLRENALETGFALDQIEESAQLDEMKQMVKDYVRTLTHLTPKQLEKALSDTLIAQLTAKASQRLPIEQPDWDYKRELDQLEKVDPEKLLEDLCALAPEYGKLCDRQKRVKPEIVEGLRDFTRFLEGEEVDPVDLPIIKFTPENRLKRRVEVSLHYPDFLETLQTGLIPVLEAFSDPTAIFAALAEGARLHLEEVIEQEGLVFFDDLLTMMAKHVVKPAFAERVRSQFRAVLIDEFQDTDPLQWEIFSTLFLDEKFEGPLYLVGDPKQSIYRFRNANLYTYLEAKKQLPNASLQTNYRSTPALVEELNTLFSKDFITLPKTGETIPSLPVAAASSLPAIDDDKGCVHVLEAEDEAALFSTIVHEIARLYREQAIPLNQFAVLVNDRYQAERFITTCPLPTVSKRSRSLLDSSALETLLELIQAAENPRDRSARARVMAGPLFQAPLEDLPEEQERFYRYHLLLQEKGLLVLFQTVVRECNLADPKLYAELLQLVEMGVHLKSEWMPFYHGLMQLDPDSEVVKARATVEDEAIQVMTIHVSKGLEFSVVFPIGIATPPAKKRGLIRSEKGFVFSDPMSEAEEHSERMRHLYVACTRAKQRLYIPLLDNGSPITSFDLSLFSKEVCQLYPEPIFESKQSFDPPEKPFEKRFSPSSTHSYTSLVTYTPERMEIPEGILPVGTQTGTLIHELFEKFPFEEKNVLPFVSRELRGTFLEEWTAEVVEMMEQALTLPLPAPDGPFTLRDVHPKKLIKEMEFLFPSDEPPGFFKGFIDLFFEHQGGIYFLDWKTNFVEHSADKVVKMHHYDVQASIYREAVERYLKIFPQAGSFKGSFYLFLRTQDVVFFDGRT